jgi:hypothetical protein
MNAFRSKHGFPILTFQNFITYFNVLIHMNHYEIFHPFCLLVKKIERRIEPWNIWVEKRILIIASNISKKKLLCKKQLQH